jgi:rod shape-determining protein MreC
MIRIRQSHFYKRLLVILVPLGFLVFFALTGLYKGPLQWIGSFSSGLVYGVQKGVYATVSGISGFFYRYINVAGLERENIYLKREVDRLYGEVNRLQEQESQIKRLTKLLEFREASPETFIAANVIGRETGPWMETLMIDKGTLDGVEPYMGVVTPRGVVGKVIKTFRHGAQVLLLTDVNSAIAAIVQRTRDEGIVHGAGMGKARLKYLSPVAEIAAGDLLVTSGLEGSFSKGVLIGRVNKVQRQGNDFFLDITVTPEMLLSKLEEVLVLTSLQNTIDEGR